MNKQQRNNYLNYLQKAQHFKINRRKRIKIYRKKKLNREHSAVVCGEMVALDLFAIIQDLLSSDKRVKNKMKLRTKFYSLQKRLQNYYSIMRIINRATQVIFLNILFFSLAFFPIKLYVPINVECKKPKRH